MNSPEISPFSLAQPEAYARWREEKLAQYPARLTDLVVEIRDPRQLRPSEREAILEHCRRANMAIYVSAPTSDKEAVHQLGKQFGLRNLDHNRGADEDAITSLTVQEDAFHGEFIPYSNRPIAWHTDGYYNDAAHQIRGLLLHAVQPAAQGGENALLDHEILYILLRDRNPDYIRALMHPQAMTIPPYCEGGEEKRPARTGPVFSVDDSDHLHLRYTHRKRNIRWREDPLTQEAVRAIQEILNDSPYVLQGKLEAGWGLISNNVLHTRTAFTDGNPPRLLYRARYYERIAET